MGCHNDYSLNGDV